MWSQIPTVNFSPRSCAIWISRLSAARLRSCCSRREAHHPHVGKSLHVEEIGIARRQEAAVFVAEDDDQRVESVLGQHIEIARPVSLVVEAAFPLGTVEGVDGQCPLGSERLFLGIADFAERLLG